MPSSLKRTEWSVASWRGMPAQQQPTYNDDAAVADVLANLSRLPPLVVAREIEALKREIEEAQKGKGFVLQGGDCAESFEDCESENIEKKLKILLKMSLVLLHGLNKPVIRIGRMAGQYAKPRSSDTETRDGVTLPCYRGDNINRPGFSAQERQADPQLLLRGYERAALTLNYVRALIDGGFADLHHPEYWDMAVMPESPQRAAYENIARSISKHLRFFEGIGGPIHEAKRVNFYTSHEGLHLMYEQTQTRMDDGNRWYNLSTHMPWIGMRTAALDGAHVELFRGIANPIGIKVGPSMKSEWVKGLIEKLNPDHEWGRLVLIHRMGAREIEKSLPPLIDAVQATGSPVLWICDPMHGNTETLSSGIKTRRFENIVTEVEAAFRIHREQGSILGGVHFELTGENVTECTGGPRGLTDSDLDSPSYTSQCDPRLNHEQALELAMRIAQLHSDLG